MTDVDISLIEQARGGNEQAMRQLAGQFSQVILGIARSYFLCGGDSEDLYQIGLIGFYDAIQRFDAVRNSDFVSFAKVCIHSRMFDAIKEASRKKHSPLNNALDFDKVSLADGGDPEHIVLQRERMLGVFSDIDEKLSVLEKQVLWLYIDGLSHKEIAERVGKSVKSVDNAISRIRGKLI